MELLIPGELILRPHACNSRNHEKFAAFVSQRFDAADYKIVVERVKFIVEMFSTQRVWQTRIVQFSMVSRVYKKLLVAYQKHAKDQDAISHPYLYKLYCLKKQRKLDQDREVLKSQQLQFDIVTYLRTWNTSISKLFELRFSNSNSACPRCDTNTWIVYLNSGAAGRLPEDACVQNLKKLYEIRKNAESSYAFLAVKGSQFPRAAGLLNWLRSKEKKFNRSEPPTCCSEPVCKSSPSRAC